MGSTINHRQGKYIRDFDRKGEKQKEANEALRQTIKRTNKTAAKRAGSNNVQSTTRMLHPRYP